MEQRPGLLERFFERVLWDSRLLMLVAVVAGVLLALGTFYLALVDLAYFFGLSYRSDSFSADDDSPGFSARSTPVC